MKRIVATIAATALFLLWVVCEVQGGARRVAPVVFPPDSGVIDVTRAPYNARGDGVTDDTAAIQRALNDYPNAGAIIYLPPGTYLISDTLTWPAGRHDGERHKRTVLQGAGEHLTTLKLRDNCPGFSSGSSVGPRYVADVPGAHILDPLTGAAAENRTSLKFESARTGGGQWYRDLVEVPGSKIAHTRSFTVEGFLKAGKQAPPRWSIILGCASIKNEFLMPWGLDVEFWDPGAHRKLRLKLRPAGYAFIQSRDAASPNVTDPGWHHFAYTYDASSGEARLHWDYKLAHTTRVSDPAKHPLRYGSDYAIQLGGVRGGNPGWNGYLDEIRYSNKVLEPNAFLKITNKAAKASRQAASTLGYWRFEGKPGGWATGVVRSEVNPKQMNGRGKRVGGAGLGKAMIWTGGRPAQRFGNGVRNLTLDTGRGNDLATGAQFMANNQGSFREVTIRSGDGKGLIGLDLGYDDEQGPCLVKNVRITGFDLGIRTKHAVNSITFEHITLRNQSKFGIENQGQIINVRGLRSFNAVPAVYNGGNPSFLTLLDSELDGPRTVPSAPAIFNAGLLFARNVKAPGYRVAIRAVAGKKADTVVGPNIVEFTSHPVISLFPSPKRSLNLPIKETPQVPWDQLSDWASPTHFGAKANADISEALQKAIDSGKTTVYIPRGRYLVGKTVLIRGAVRRIIGCEPWLDSASKEGPMFRFVDGGPDVVVVERISGGYQRRVSLVHAARRTLVVSACCNFSVTKTGEGDLFVEDVCANPWTSFRFGRGNVWARQINPEFREGTHLVNRGGTVWILGMKVEAGNTMIETTDGGRTELLGAFCYTNIGPRGAPMFISRDSSISLTVGEAFFNPRATPYLELVRETRGGEIRVLKKGQVPGRCGGSAMPLFVGYGTNPP